MGKFSWGPTFLEINRELLDIYASCTDAKDVVDKQNSYIQTQKEVCNFIIYMNKVGTKAKNMLTMAENEK